MAMKAGMSAKITVGVIGILVAGFLGFQAIQRQKGSDQVDTGEPNYAVAERSRGNIGEKFALSHGSSQQHFINGAPISTDERSPERFDKRELMEFLAWLTNWSSWTL